MTDFLYHFNPNHDKLGRFAKSSAGNRSVLEFRKDQAYERYVDTSDIKDKIEKRSVETKVFTEANNAHNYNDGYEISKAIHKRIVSGRNFVKDLEKLEKRENKIPFDRDWYESRGRKDTKPLVGEKKMSKILKEAGYENTKAGRKYVDNLFKTNYFADAYNIE